MSVDYKSHKKQDLVKALTLVNVKVLNKDKKAELVEKCEAYVNEYGEVGALKLHKYLVEDGEIVAEEDDVATLAESEEDVEDVEEDEEEDDDDEDDDDDDDEEEDDEDEDDKDYNAPPPLDLRTLFGDSAIEKWEQFKDKVYGFTDDVGISVANHSDKLRDELSLTVALNYLELVVEALVYLSVFVPWVPLRENTLALPFENNLHPVLAKWNLPTPQVSALFSCSSIGALAVWLVTLVVLPLITSYYVNFTTRILTFDGLDLVGRVHDYDPFVFALTKVLVYYFIANNGKQYLFANDGHIYAALNKVVIAVGNYGKLSTALSLFPLVVGVANVAVALYSQFEH